MQKIAAAKDVEINKRNAELDTGQDKQKLAVAEAVGALEKERDDLKQSELEKQLSE